MAEVSCQKADQAGFGIVYGLVNIDNVFANFESITSCQNSIRIIQKSIQKILIATVATYPILYLYINLIETLHEN